MEEERATSKKRGEMDACMHAKRERNKWKD